MPSFLTVISVSGNTTCSFTEEKGEYVARNNSPVRARWGAKSSESVATSISGPHGPCKSAVEASVAIIPERKSSTR